MHFSVMTDHTKTAKSDMVEVIPPVVFDKAANF